MTDADLTAVPAELRDGLPAELAEAEIVGSETAAVDDSLRLYGPPGTGKTTQIALRLAALMLGEPDLGPSDMTVVTYRKALAATTRRRLAAWGALEHIDDLDDVNPNSNDADNPFRFWNTIHAGAARATAFHDRIDSDDRLSGMVTDDYPSQKYEFCKENDIRCYPQNPWETTRWQAFYQLYTYAKSNLLDVGHWRHVAADDLRPLRSDNRAEELLETFREEWGNAVNFRQIVHKWESFKAEHDCHDFYEQLEAALVGPLPETRVVVVDEYHDATPLMAAVCERWVEAAETAIVAGDPDQVCNGYAGASPRFFEGLGDRVERDMPVVLLDHSWRCPDEHFEAAARVLSQERNVPDVTTSGRGELRRYTSSHYDEENGDWRQLPDRSEAASPVRLWENYGSDIMFLTRTQKQVDAVAAALDEAGIIYKSQPDALNVEADWQERLTLLNALATLEGVTRADTAGLDDFDGDAAHQPRSASNYALSVEETRTLLEHTHRQHLDSRRSDWHLWLLNHEEEAGDTVPVELLTEHVSRTWWNHYTSGKESLADLTGLSDRDTEAMAAAWERYDRFDDKEPATAATRVLTIHASKGSEASDVVIFDGITKSIEERHAENADARENGARTWYVALTRASDRLHIVRAAFEYMVPFLPDDLEPVAAKATQDKLAATDGGEPQ